MSKTDLANTNRSIKRHLLGGIAIAVILIGGAGSWSVLASIQSAVIAPGTVAVRSYKKRVQHLQGGMVSHIKVQDGDKVAKGDILVRLDDTQTLAELAVLRNRALDLRIRRNRLLAERDARTKLSVPDSLQRQAHGNVDLEAILSVQQNLFNNRLEMRKGRKAQMKERISQLRQEIGGLRAILAGKDGELKLLRSELAGLQGLKAKGLVPVTKLNALGRNIAQTEGERGRVVADIARAFGRIAEMKLQIIELTERFADDALRDLQPVEAKLAELGEQQQAAKDRHQKLIIRAPQAGTVHELSVHTIGGVIRPGETVLLLVPQSDELVVDAMVSPQDIDQIARDRPVRVRFTSLNQRTTPELRGRVLHIAADHSGGSTDMPLHFKVRVQILDGEIAKLGGLKIVPGMPAEVMITSASRTVLTYLTKPLTDQFNRAFRDR